MGIFNFNEVPAGKRPEVKLNILAERPNRDTIDDPNWDDPKDGSMAPAIKKYTDGEWMDEIIWAHLKELNEKGHKKRQALSAGKAPDIRVE
jgi:hypothetical protein